MKTRKYKATKGRMSDAEKALKDLFQHCVMVHKHWGDGSNRREADAAIAAAARIIQGHRRNTP